MNTIKTEVPGSSPGWPTIEPKSVLKSMDNFILDHSLFQNLVPTNDLNSLVQGYILNCQCEGKSLATIGTYEEHLRRFCWYNEMLKAFVKYLEANGYPGNMSSFNIDIVRGYILYLQHKRKYEGHPFTPYQEATLSPQTIRCHVRALKAFSTWLYLDEHTESNIVVNQRNGTLFKPNTLA